MTNDVHLSSEGYLSKVIQRLTGAGFRVNANIKFKNQTFEYIAKKRTFQAEKFGWVDKFFLFALFPQLDFSTLKAYSNLSFKYTKKASGIHMPPSLLYMLECFPVAVTYSLENHAAEVIEMTDPPKHWGSAEIPVAYCASRGELYYYQTNPPWRSLYHDIDRRTVREMLSPEDLIPTS